MTNIYKKKKIRILDNPFGHSHIMDELRYHEIWKYQVTIILYNIAITFLTLRWSVSQSGHIMDT